MATQTWNAAFALASSPLTKYKNAELLNVNALADKEGHPYMLRSIVYKAELSPHVQTVKRTLIKDVAIKYQKAERDSINEAQIHAALTQVSVPQVRALDRNLSLYQPASPDWENAYMQAMLDNDCTNVVRLYHHTRMGGNFFTDSGLKPSDVRKNLSRTFRDPTDEEATRITNLATPAIVMVMELAEFSLHDLLTKNAERSAYMNDSFILPCILQVLCTLYYLGAMHFTHQDLKLDNILMRQSSTQTNGVLYYILDSEKTVTVSLSDTKQHFCKLSDFGFSTANFRDGNAKQWTIAPSTDRFAKWKEGNVLDEKAGLEFRQSYDISSLGFSLLRTLLLVYARDQIRDVFIEKTRKTLDIALQLMTVNEHPDAMELAKMVLNAGNDADGLIKIGTEIDTTQKFSELQFTLAKKPPSLSTPKTNKSIILSTAFNEYTSISTKDAISNLSRLEGINTGSSLCLDMTLRPLIEYKKRLSPEKLSVYQSP